MREGPVFEERDERGGALWPWVALVLAILAGFLFLCNRSEITPVAEEEAVPAIEGTHIRSAVLYFADVDGERLVPERRELTLVDGGREDFVRRLVAELARGPLAGEGWPTVPGRFRVKGVFFDDLGELYVDVVEEGLREWTWGTSSEILAIRSLVRTLAASFPEVVRVGILVNGSAVESLGGHVDARHPFEVAEWR
ncbi:MAG: GerMN domain-containing protein [Candidatus Eisenbacteria bacterium]